MPCFKYSNVVILIVLFFSCSGNTVFDRVDKIPVEGWDEKSQLSFTASITDTLEAYAILFHLRNDNSFEYSNIWLFVETTGPNGDVLNDTVEFILADANGKWQGSGLGSVNSMLLAYKENIRFPYRGVYTFSIAQGMRKEKLVGIKDFGVRIQKYN